MLSIQEFSSKIKQKYPEYANVDDTELAKKVVAKYPEYQGKVNLGGSQAGGNPLEGVGNFLQGVSNFGVNVGGGIVRGAGGVVDFAGQVVDPVTNINRLSRTLQGKFQDDGGSVLPKDWQVLQRAGSAVGSGANWIADTNQRASGQITGKSTNDWTTWGGDLVGQGAVGLSGAAVGGQGATNLLSKFFPALNAGKKVAQTTDTAQKALTFGQKLSQGAKSTPEFLARTVGETQGALATQGKLATPEDYAWGTGIDAGFRFGPTIIKGIGKEVLSKASGLPIDAIKTAFNYGDELSKVQKIGAQRYGDEVLENLKNNLRLREEALEDTGKLYGSIRRSGQTANLGKNWLDDSLSAVGLTPKATKSGTKLVYNADSAIRHPKDLSRLGEIYDTFSKIDKPTPNQILNLRSDLSDLVENAKNKVDIGRFATELRKKVDDVAKRDLKGLSSLDEQFSRQKSYLDSIKNEFLKEDGSYRDTLDNLMNRLGTHTNRSKLGRIKELKPDLPLDVELLRAAKAIESATGNQVGNYGRNIITGGSALSGNLPLAVASILTNPTVVTELAKKIGKFSKILPKRTKDVLSAQLKNPRKAEPTNSINFALPKNPELKAGKSGIEGLDYAKFGSGRYAKIPTRNKELMGGKFTSLKNRPQVIGGKDLAKNLDSTEPPEPLKQLLKEIKEYEQNIINNSNQGDKIRIAPSDFISKKSNKKYESYLIKAQKYSDLGKTVENKPDVIQNSHYSKKENYIRKAIDEANKLGEKPVVSLDVSRAPVIYFRTPVGQMSYHLSPVDIGVSLPKFVDFMGIKDKVDIVGVNVFDSIKDVRGKAEILSKGGGLKDYIDAKKPSEELIKALDEYEKALGEGKYSVDGWKYIPPKGHNPRYANFYTAQENFYKDYGLMPGRVKDLVNNYEVGKYILEMSQ